MTVIPFPPAPGQRGGPPYDWAADPHPAPWSLDQDARDRHPTNRLRPHRHPDNHGDGRSHDTSSPTHLDNDI